MDFSALPQQRVTYTLAGEQISLNIPDSNWIFENYSENNGTGFPYWSKIWPASFALTEWMSQHSNVFHEKIVLELGAGLALPSLLAARWARAVIATDNDKQAIQFLQQNLDRYAYSKVRTLVYDWCSPDPLPSADILLLADVNYQPTQFEPLLQQLQSWQAQQKIILLATPHRLSGRPFIEQLLALGFQSTPLPESAEAPGVTCSLYSANLTW